MKDKTDRRVLNKEDALELLRTSPDAYTMTLLRSWLGATADKKARFSPGDIIDVPREFRDAPPGDPGEGRWDVRWAPGWSSIKSTTVGRLIANCLPFSRSRALREVVPYKDSPWNNKAIESIEQTVMDAMLAGLITNQDMDFFIDRMQWLGYAPTAFVDPSMTIDTVRAPKATKKLKEQILASERGDRIRAGDMVEAIKVEKELIESAVAEREGKDPGFDLFASGSRGSIANNLKVSTLMRGAIRKSDDPSKVTISTASLEEGIPAEELPQYADLIVQASSGRALMTAQGGYIAKQLNAAFQGVHLDPDPESDCRTTLTLRVTVDNPREYLFRFYAEGNRLVEITPKDLDGLKGKTLKFRTPLYCGGKKGLCSRCAGTLHYRMGVTNVGLVASRIGTTLLNASLKGFHDATVKTTRIDLSKYVKEL